MRVIAGTCLLLSLQGFIQCSWAAVQAREQLASEQQKRSPDRPALARSVFGSGGNYAAELSCCWHISVYENRANGQVMIWDWDKFEGWEGFKEDLLTGDLDADGNEEMAFRVSKTSFCRLESSAVLYCPEERMVYLLRYDGDIGLHLSPNLKDNQKAREWLIKYWQDWYKGDLNKITVTYDLAPCSRSGQIRGG